MSATDTLSDLVTKQTANHELKHEVPAARTLRNPGLSPFRNWGCGKCLPTPSKGTRSFRADQAGHRSHVPETSTIE